MTALALSPWYVIPAMTLIALAAGYSGWRLLRLLSIESHPQQPDLAEQISHLLPQTQCGQCGFSGCAPYARAIAEGEAINKCPPGGERTIRLLADLMRKPVIALDPAHGTHMPPRVAFIREDECIGCTKCIQACPVDAILGAPRLMHTVIAGECTGCDLCVDPCPVDCIDMLTAAAHEPPQWQFPGSGQEELAGSEGLGDSTESDVCANIGPGHISRVQHYRTGKDELDQEAKQLQLSDYRKERFEERKRRLARDAAMRRGSRRRSVARPENPEIADAGLQAFSRDQARQEIAAAVARVKQRRQVQKPFLTVDSETSNEEDR